MQAYKIKKGTLTYKPFVLLSGASGTGKTDAIGSLLASGLRVAVIDIERRLESIQQYEPLVLACDTRPDIAKALKVMQDAQARREFVKQATGGEWEDVDVLAFDSLLEYEWMLDQDLRVEHANSSNKFARWDDYGQKIIKLCRELRKVATVNGAESVGVLATLGTIPYVSQNGLQYETLPFKGKVAPDRLHFQFGVVLRLHATVEQGEPRWYLYTTKGEGWYAKAPPVLPAVVDVTKGKGGMEFHEVWKTLERFYAGKE